MLTVPQSEPSKFNQTRTKGDGEKATRPHTQRKVEYSTKCKNIEQQGVTKNNREMPFILTKQPNSRTGDAARRITQTTFVDDVFIILAEGKGKRYERDAMPSKVKQRKGKERKGEKKRKTQHVKIAKINNRKT